MTYQDYLNTTLSIKDDATFDAKVIDLFAGCGGLSLGFESVGFKTIGYEVNQDASSTYNENLGGICFNQLLTTETEYPNADVLIGGPPCQPFSVGGHQLGLKDSRDGFPIFLSALRQVKPKVFLIENVRGLLYKNKWYLDQIISECEKLGYDIAYNLLNAKDFEVPQNRERVIIIGVLKSAASMPKPKNRLITAGDALGKLASQIPNESKFLTPGMDKYIAKYEKASSCINPRDLILSKPARTLTCRNLAGSTGDMQRIRLLDGRRRRLTITEAARLQSFPDWYNFQGNETSIYTQIGNSVAPMFAYHLALHVKNLIVQPSAARLNRRTLKQTQLQMFLS